VSDEKEKRMARQNEQDSPRGLGNLLLITTPGDGNCQFSAIARALRNSGINAFRRASNASITMQSLRAFMAERITPGDISDLLDTYGTMESCAWLNKIDYNGWTAEQIIEYVKRGVASSKPVIYQGDDWSLGILARELRLYFIVVRDDGSIQGGLPTLEEGTHIIVLYFYDMNPNGQPSGATNGHYDLIAVKDDRYPDGKTVFTLGTLPTSLLIKVKEHQRMNKTTPPPSTPDIEATMPTLSIREDTKPVLAKPALIFPMQCVADPTTSDQWVLLLEASIVTAPERMRYYSRLEPTPFETFEQLYTLVFVRSDAQLKVTLTETTLGLYIFSLVMQIEDPIDGPGDPIEVSFDNGREAFEWFMQQVGKDDALAKARVRTTASNVDVSIQFIDRALVVPLDV
jgi:hypothetical protein